MQAYKLESINKKIKDKLALTDNEVELLLNINFKENKDNIKIFINLIKNEYFTVVNSILEKEPTLINIKVKEPNLPKECEPSYISLLSYFSVAGNTTHLKYILSKNPDYYFSRNENDTSPYLPMHLAISKNKLDNFEFLIKNLNLNDIFQIDDMKKNTVFYCIEYNRLDMLRKTLELKTEADKISIDIYDNIDNFFTLKIMNSLNTGIFKLLMDNDYYIKKQDEQDFIQVISHYALNGKTKPIEYFLKYPSFEDILITNNKVISITGSLSVAKGEGYNTDILFKKFVSLPKISKLKGDVQFNIILNTFNKFDAELLKKVTENIDMSKIDLFPDVAFGFDHSHKDSIKKLDMVKNLGVNYENKNKNQDTFFHKIVTINKSGIEKTINYLMDNELIDINDKNLDGKVVIELCTDQNKTIIEKNLINKTIRNDTFYQKPKKQRL